MGGKPEKENGVFGSLHRMILDIIKLFQEDIKAALKAIDDGGEKLAEKIEDKLDYEREHLNVKSITLLEKILRSAKDGERFAEGYKKAA